MTMVMMIMLRIMMICDSLENLWFVLVLFLLLHGESALGTPRGAEHIIVNTVVVIVAIILNIIIVFDD